MTNNDWLNSLSIDERAEFMENLFWQVNKKFCGKDGCPWGKYKSIGQKSEECSSCFKKWLHKKYDRVNELFGVENEWD